jgi:hypothetical protein
MRVSSLSNDQYVLDSWENKYQELTRTTNPVHLIEMEAAKMAHLFIEEKWMPDESEYLFLLSIAAGVQVPDITHYDGNAKELEQDIRNLCSAICRTMKRNNDPVEHAKKELGQVLLGKLYEGKLHAIVA